jgi:predicted nucleic acid-binding protein
MNGLVVIDASLAVKWLVEEVDTEKADALSRSWITAGVQPAAPYLMPAEATNALYRKVVQQQLSLDAAFQLLERLAVIGIELMEPRGLHRRAIELAGSLQQGAVYDAHYLALAQIMDCEMWTADERFFRAANRRFPEIHWLGET